MGWVLEVARNREEALVLLVLNLQRPITYQKL